MWMEDYFVFNNCTVRNVLFSNSEAAILLSQIENQLRTDSIDNIYTIDYIKTKINEVHSQTDRLAQGCSDLQNHLF